MDKATQTWCSQVNADLAELFRRPPVIGGAASDPARRAELVANALKNGAGTGSPRAGWRDTDAYARLRYIAEPPRTDLVPLDQWHADLPGQAGLILVLKEDVGYVPRYADGELVTTGRTPFASRVTAHEWLADHGHGWSVITDHRSGELLPERLDRRVAKGA